MNQKSLVGFLLNKAAKIIFKFVTYNTKYKPLGTVSLSSLVSKKLVEHCEINAPYVSQLNLTKQFVNDCSSYNKPALSVQYPGDYIISIPQGRIYNVNTGNIAVISGDNQLIEELSFQWRSGEKLAPGTDNVIFSQKVFTTPKKYAGNVFSLLSGGGAVDYFYHWVIDSIPKLHLLEKSGQLDKIDYFLVPNYVHKFQLEFLAHYGIKEEKIINAESVRHIQADCLMVASYIRIMAHLPKWVPEFLNKSFIKGEIKRDKLIYIGRGDAARNRKVLNEAELIEMLKPFGFEVHYLSQYSVQEQAQLFNSAKMIIASHGGGLTNLVFCGPGTKVLEFFPDNYVNHLFYDIANKRELEYDYLVCSAQDFTGNDLDRAAANVVADLDAIKSKVSALFPQTRKDVA